MGSSVIFASKCLHLVGLKFMLVARKRDHQPILFWKMAGLFWNVGGRYCTILRREAPTGKLKNGGGYSLQDGDDQSDDICSVCHHGGDIILCDKCPSSFHHSYLGLKEVPEGEWACPSCRCGVCGQSKFEDTQYSKDDDMVRICDQCEHKFHMECIKKRTGVVKLKDYSKNKWFCSDKCENVYSSLNELLGRPFPPVVDNLTWTLLKSMEEEEHQDPNDDSSENEALVQNQSKLNMALELMRECIEPVREILTGKDLVEDVIFNCRSNLNQWQLSECMKKWPSYR
ncbi:hypothetical protein Ddye_006668 [Dipteronia dyeriana]|uniref:PHD-type domain-containing protein n=1 Tax=Dipteronia dyeriana TaxID=168575 RepID=A0AAD9XIH7_9ROSI|nr:hypothetical protein Ddye_006668 [Dipteronia dyeriana]